MLPRLSRLVLPVCLVGISALAISQEPKPETPSGTEPKAKSCEAQFLAARRTETDWYPDHDFKHQPAHCKTATQKISATKSIPIYWAVIANDWTKATAKEKVDAAKKWFERYCVTINDKFVDLNKLTNYKTIVKALNDANASGRDDYAKMVYNDFVQTWKRAGSPTDRFLMVLFFDAYKEVEFTQSRWSDVSGNYADQPLILISAKDKGREHIFTHEVLHGLGKVLHNYQPSSPGARPTAPVGSEPYFDGVANSKSSWDEAPCPEDMGNPDDLSAAKNDAPMDWAAYYEYVYVAKTLK